MSKEILLHLHKPDQPDGRESAPTQEISPAHFIKNGMLTTPIGPPPIDTLQEHVLLIYEAAYALLDKQSIESTRQSLSKLAEYLRKDVAPSVINELVRPFTCALPAIVQFEESRIIAQRLLELVEYYNTDPRFYRDGLQAVDFINRALAVNYELYAELLTAAEHDRLYQQLMRCAPLSMLPSVPMKQLPERFENSVQTNGAITATDFVIAAYPYDNKYQIACYRVERCNRENASLSRSAGVVFYEGVCIGVIKSTGERSLLAFRNIMQDGRLVFARGGVYTPLEHLRHQAPTATISELEPQRIIPLHITDPLDRTFVPLRETNLADEELHALERQYVQALTPDG